MSSNPGRAMKRQQQLQSSKARKKAKKAAKAVNGSKSVPKDYVYGGDYIRANKILHRRHIEEQQRLRSQVGQQLGVNAISASTISDLKAGQIMRVGNMRVAVVGSSDEIKLEDLSEDMEVLHEEES